MSFVVKVKVPEMLFWEVLTVPMNESLRSANVDDKQRGIIIHQYAFILRMKSWEHGIDWDPQHNIITVEVPNKFAQQSTMREDGLMRDGLCSMAEEILEKTPLIQVVAHFRDITKNQSRPRLNND